MHLTASGSDLRHRTDRRSRSPGNASMNDALHVLAWLVAIPAVGSLMVLAATRAGEAKARRREMFARAYAACQAYREFPHVVRRRGTSDPEAKRLRISGELRQVQQELAFCVGWMTTESTAVSEAYREFVDSVRAVAGREIRKAWESEPARSDRAMSMIVDLSGIKLAEEAYLAAVRRRLAFMWWRAPAPTAKKSPDTLEPG
jgi:hypothetical protein